LFFQFLQKIYKEDLDEVALEADEDLKNERKAAKETVGVICFVTLVTPRHF
jgi:hypothetical protein